ncbi:hypothetical protein B9G99_09505 [Kushneria konosiri]|uniref:Uncharacterized protein n=1 Tax=Kushneria konosiri TaxID=698828 RepID=A0A2Z2HC80_9GAMM|nr:hypothetical protein B9G99_09505 [Kushneria konosiri]
MQFSRQSPSQGADQGDVMRPNGRRRAFYACPFPVAPPATTMSEIITARADPFPDAQRPGGTDMIGAAGRGK